MLRMAIYRRRHGTLTSLRQNNLSHSFITHCMFQLKVQQYHEFSGCEFLQRHVLDLRWRWVLAKVQVGALGLIYNVSENFVCLSLHQSGTPWGTHLCYPNTFQIQPSLWPWLIIYYWTVAAEREAGVWGVFYFRDETDQGQWKQRSAVVKTELTKKAELMKVLQ